MPKFDLYSPLSSWKDGYPLSPVVSVVVGDLFVSGGRQRLSSDLATEFEVDEAFNSLIDELETLRKKAKIELARILAATLDK